MQVDSRNLFATGVAVGLVICAIAGCSSEENLLDSYSKKRKATTSATAAEDVDIAVAGDIESQEVPTEQDTSQSASTQTVVAKPVESISDKAFLEAAAQGNGPMVAVAIESGVNVNVSNEKGTTALMLAAYDGHTEIVKLLIKHNAQVNRVDLNKRTALIYSASGKNPETVAALIDAGAKVDIADGQEAWTALMFAAAEGNPEVVKILLANGADPKRGDVDGETSLQFAASKVSKGHAEVLKLLQAAIQ